MRHRKKGRVLGRSPSHRVALFRNLASALFLTERDADLDDNEPAVKGRIITTLQKAKEVRPLVERCITIARKGLEAEDAARPYATTAARNSESWKTWREGSEWKKWNQAISPAVKARRRVVRLLGDKQAMRILFSTVAPRFVGRTGGYTRILRLAKPRLGDAGTRAILEFVGVRDRVSQRMQAPRVEAGEA
jgi:large subunit ribosomal protein L17